MAIWGVLRSLFGGASTASSNEEIDSFLEESHTETVAQIVAAPVEEPAFEAPQEAQWWVPRGAPVMAPRRADDKKGVVEARLYREIVGILDDPNLDLPRVPHVSQRALGMLRNDTVNFSELAKVIGTDAALAGEFLRIANTAAYRRVSEVKRLDQALPRLGERKIRALLIATAARGLSIRNGDVEQEWSEELWRRGLASAAICVEFSKDSKVAEEDAFLAGLMHDIGMLAVLKVVFEYRAKTGERTTRPVFDQLCEEWHQHIGLRLADAWNLPNPIPEIIASHHKRPSQDDPNRDLRLLTQFSDVCCSMMEFAPYTPFDFFELDCVRRLRITPEPNMLRRLAALPEQIGEQLEVE
ncbi:MAG: HDOD domain-containing protein [Phycisphaerales bacterium]|nr:HDOD domain-containing protein [Phycisphaerales bacterium]